MSVLDTEMLGPYLLQGLNLLAVALGEEDQAVAIAQVGV